MKKIFILIFIVSTCVIFAHKSLLNDFYGGENYDYKYMCPHSWITLNGIELLDTFHQTELFKTLPDNKDYEDEPKCNLKPVESYSNYNDKERENYMKYYYNYEVKDMLTWGSRDEDFEDVIYCRHSPYITFSHFWEQDAQVILKALPDGTIGVSYDAIRGRWLKKLQN